MQSLLLLIVQCILIINMSIVCYYSVLNVMLIIIDVLFSSSLGDFQSAVPYCKRSCETVGVVYGRNSVEVGNEKEKLSQLLFHR